MYGIGSAVFYLHCAIQITSNGRIRAIVVFLACTYVRENPTVYWSVACYNMEVSPPTEYEGPADLLNLSTGHIFWYTVLLKLASWSLQCMGGLVLESRCAVRFAVGGEWKNIQWR